MLALFRTNQAYAGLLLFVYALVLWLPYYLTGAPMTTEVPGEGVLGESLTEMLAGSPVPAYLLSVLLVGLQGLQANAWAGRHRLSRQVTQFPGLFVVLTTSLVAGGHGTHSFHLANVLLLFTLLALGRLYKREEPAVALFNAGAWLGLATLLRPGYLLFLPACLMAIAILRRLDLRSVLQLLTGLGLVYFFLAVTGYLNGNWRAYFDLQLSPFGLASFQAAPADALAGLGALALLLLAVLLFFSRIGVMLNIEGSKNLNLLGWFLLWAGVAALFAPELTAGHAQYLVVPLGILLGLGVLRLRKRQAEVVHFLLLVVVWLPLVI